MLPLPKLNHLTRLPLQSCLCSLHQQLGRSDGGMRRQLAFSNGDSRKAVEAGNPEVDKDISALIDLNYWRNVAVKWISHPGSRSGNVPNLGNNSQNEGSESRRFQCALCEQAQSEQLTPGHEEAQSGRSAPHVLGHALYLIQTRIALACNGLGLSDQFYRVHGRDNTGFPVVAQSQNGDIRCGNYSVLFRGISKEFDNRRGLLGQRLIQTITQGARNVHGHKFVHVSKSYTDQLSEAFRLGAVFTVNHQRSPKSTTRDQLITSKGGSTIVENPYTSAKNPSKSMVKQLLMSLSREVVA